MRMASRPELPSEILDAILNDCGAPELSKLCAVCRGLWRICAPRLYKDIIFSLKQHVNKPKQPLHAFLVTALHRPDLAATVRSVQFDDDLNIWPRAWWNTWGMLKPLAEQDIDLARRIILRSRMPLAAKMIHFLRFSGRHNFDAAVALLLLLLPNLQSAHLMACFHHCAQHRPLMFLPVVLKHVLVPPKIDSSCLPRSLHHMGYPGHCTGPWAHSLDQPAEDILWLFYIRDVHSISARIIENGRCLRWPRIAPFQRSLQSLRLLRSCICLGALRTLLLACPNLKEFEYQHCCDMESVTTTPLECRILDCVGLKEALRSVENSLESLILSVLFYATQIYDSQGGDNIEYGIYGFLGDLNNFNKLKYLEAPLVMLVGYKPLSSSVLTHNLPASLCELCCSNELVEWHIFEWKDEHVLLQLLPLIMDRDPPLENFIFGAKESRWLWWGPLRIAIKEACEAKGVSYDTLWTKYDELDPDNLPHSYDAKIGWHSEPVNEFKYS